MASDPRWPGVPCESDAWPFAIDISVFETRRAIGQLVRTASSIAKLADPEKLRTANPALLYLAAAHSLSRQMGSVMADLVSEARARGSSWVEIGEALDVGDTAAQKRYGKGIASERYLQLAEEAFVIDFVARSASAGSDEEIDEVLEELAGTTPAERVQYSFEIIRGTLSEFDAIKEELKKDEPDATLVWRRLFNVHEKNTLLVTTLLVDPEQWRAVAEWSGHPSSPDEANYHSPASYIYLVMRQAWLVAFWTAFSLREDEPDFGQVMEQFTKANEVTKQMTYILMRDDVNRALSTAVRNESSEA
jgi:hypothetical protein